MEDDEGVYHLVQLIFVKQSTNPEVIRAENPSVPTCLLTKEFSQCMQEVMTMRQILLLHRWKKFFDTCCFKMLSSHEMYLKYVVYACLVEHEFNQSVFDSFIRACTFVRHLSIEVLTKTGVNLYDLNPDIIKVFYKKYLKAIFCRRGGFRRLVEYVLKHRYRRLKNQRKDPVLLDEARAPFDYLDMGLAGNIKKAIKKERVFEEEIDPKKIEFDPVSYALARQILRDTTVQLPTLPSYSELVMRLVEFRKSEKYGVDLRKKRIEAAAKLEAMKIEFQESSNLTTDSKTSMSKQKKRWSEHEETIQAVIRCNRSKHSADEKANSEIQKEIEGILERLKNTIKLFLEILDDDDNE